MREGKSIPCKVRLRSMEVTPEGKEIRKEDFFGEVSTSEDGTVLSICYEEVIAEGSISTLVIPGKENAVIERSGQMQSRMTFDIRQDSRFLYETPFGGLPLEIHTEKLDLKERIFPGGESESRMDLSMEYDLLQNGISLGHHIVNLTVSYTL